MQSLINAISEMLYFFDEFKISHVKREHNVEVDKLSKWVLSFEGENETQLEDLRNVVLNP